MSQALIILASQKDRDKATRWIAKAPWNTRVTFRGPARTLPQNDRLWASLSEIAEQLTWHGMKLSASDWRTMMMAALGGETRMVPNIHGNGFVDLGRSSSRLDKEDFSSLLEIVAAFAAEHNVKFSDKEGA